MLGWDKKKEKKKVYKRSLFLTEDYFLMGVTDVFGVQVDCDVINSR